MKTLIFVLTAVLLSTAAMAIDARDICKDNGFEYGVSTWACSDNSFALESNTYLSWTTDVKGDCSAASWSTSQSVDGIVVQTELGQTQALAGGSYGDLTAGDGDSLSKVTFCGYNHGHDDGAPITQFVATEPSGVPEFSTLTLGAAVLASLFGLVALRRN